MIFYDFVSSGASLSAAKLRTLIINVLSFLFIRKFSMFEQICVCLITILVIYQKAIRRRLENLAFEIAIYTL